MTHLDVANLLAETPQNLSQLLKHTSDDLAQWRPSENEWCINEAIGHLIWADKFAFTDRIKLMTSENGSNLPILDVNQAALDRQDHLKSLDELLKEFQTIRAENVAYIRELEPSLLSNHADYKERVWLASDFLYEWPFHDYGHVKQIMNILRANLVPFMSDTMRRAVGF